jgi:DHHC palmitoyltransferase
MKEVTPFEQQTPTYSSLQRTHIPNEALSAWVFYLAVSAAPFTCIESWIVLAVALLLHLATAWLMLTTGRRPGYLATGEDAEAGLRRCERCNISQPLRTKHCHDCDRCVATFDHHCFWIGACVGEMNHRRFVLMLIAIFCTVTFDLTLLSLALLYRDLEVWVNTVYTVCVVLLVLPTLLAAVLLFYHIYLISTAQTTWENLSRLSISYLQDIPFSVCPFSKGLISNVAEFTNRGSSGVPIKWEPQWKEGDTVPFSWCENDYWNCC